MRCQRARSYLSAYCNDELSGRQKLAVSEHLATCSTCRKEEALYRSLGEARSAVPSMKVSKDFNTALLNRIAQERFAETRTRAFMPHAAPRFAWGKILPVAVSACAVALMAMFTVGPSLRTASPDFAVRTGLDDSYLTVQPTNNPNMTASMHQGWSLNNQLARVQRINDISNSFVRPSGFAQPTGMGLANVAARTIPQAPYSATYYRVRQIHILYAPPDANSPKEVNKAY